MEGVLGFTTLFAGNFAPRGWMMCQGQLLSVASNTALFSVIGTSYGGTGNSTFALPNLQGRVVVGAGQGPGLASYVVGQAAGNETETMIAAQLPSHTHPLTVVASNPANGSGAADQTAAQDDYYAPDINGLTPYTTTPALNMGPIQAVLETGITGGSQAFSTLRPLLGLNYIICVEGLFPTRN